MVQRIQKKNFSPKVGFDHSDARKKTFACDKTLFFLSHNLTENQSIQYVKWYRQSMKIFDKGQFQYMNDIVTGDEIWLCYCEMLNKSQNKDSVFEGKDESITIRKSQSIRKNRNLLFKWNRIVRTYRR